MVKKKAAHRPLKYGEETQVVQFRVPKSKVKTIKTLVNNFLSKCIKVKRNDTE
jgi:hypothetical protein